MRFVYEKEDNTGLLDRLGFSVIKVAYSDHVALYHQGLYFGEVSIVELTAAAKSERQFLWWLDQQFQPVAFWHYDKTTKVIWG